MSDWDPVRAWAFIRASRGYRTAWRRRRPQPGLLEPAPFEIRWQTAADVDRDNAIVDLHLLERDGDFPAIRVLASSRRRSKNVLLMRIIDRDPS